MSQNIRLVSVEIENYRQYYGNHKVNFASREEGFTVIMGKNGEGKSNLLNAINWCLYENEPHGIGEDVKEHESEKYNSLLSILNKCDTAIGRRLCKQRLLYPILDINILNNFV